MQNTIALLQLLTGFIPPLGLNYFRHNLLPVPVNDSASGLAPLAYPLVRRRALPAVHVFYRRLQNRDRPLPDDAARCTLLSVRARVQILSYPVHDNV